MDLGRFSYFGLANFRELLAGPKNLWLFFVVILDNEKVVLGTF